VTGGEVAAGTGPRISVVMPAFNEEADLEAAVTEVVEGLSARGLDTEVLVVENGSTDGTRRLALELGARLGPVRALTLDQPDYGRALRAGLLDARGCYVVNFDVDYVDLTFVDRALELMDGAGGPHLVVGTKRGRGSLDTRRWHRRLVTAVYSRLLRSAFGLGVSDTHGMKAMRRGAVLELARACRTGTDLFDTELVLRAERAGLRVAEIPVVVVERRPSRTSILHRLPRTVRGLVVLHRDLRREAGQPAATAGRRAVP
jgi:glycosyltransferase involved in cell wall biosynthesis